MVEFALRLISNNLPRIEPLSTCFLQMIKQEGEVYIILDALEECQTRNGTQAVGLLSWIKNSLNVNYVHLLITSRLEEDIKLDLDVWIEEQISIQNNHVDKDISMYACSRVRQNDGFKRWRSRPEVQKEIETTLSTKANGI